MDSFGSSKDNSFYQFISGSKWWFSYEVRVGQMNPMTDRLCARNCGLFVVG